MRVSSRPRPTRWTAQCSAILAALAARSSNAEIADQIAKATGTRFSVFTVSRYRAAAGLRQTRENACLDRALKGCSSILGAAG